MRRTPLGKAIDAARERKGLKVGQLAALMSVSSATASDWCYGRYAPTVAHLTRLAGLLDTTVGDLLGEKAAA